MGLSEVIGKSVAAIRGTIDPERDSRPAISEDLHVELKQQFARLHSLLEETRKASREKDELIARLQASGATEKNMISDGAACFIRRNKDTLDGPFCLACFEGKERVVRVVPAPRPKGKKGAPSEWIQCPECQVPFRSRRVGEYLKTQQTAIERSRSPRQAGGKTKAQKPRSKPQPVSTTRRQKR